MDWWTPPGHRAFKAAMLARNLDDEILDCAIAVIEPRGGGPQEDHCHAHDHPFVVISGCATIRMDGESIALRESQALRVPGSTAHSVWNETDAPVKMAGISLKVLEP